MQHFSNYFVQILVIRSKCQRGEGEKDGPERRKNPPPCPLLPAPMKKIFNQMI